MSPAGKTLRALIAAARRRLHRDTAIAIVAAVLAVPPIVLLLAWLLAGVTIWSAAPTWWPLAIELLALSAAVALVVWGLRRWARGLGEPEVAATAEAKLGLPPGSVRGILELGRTVPKGASAALFSREEMRIARHFVGQRPRDLSGPIGVRVRRRRMLAVAVLGGLVIVTGTLGFMSPERSMRGWTPLLQPVAHLTPPPLPALEVLPGDTEVTRGSDVRVRVTAPGRSLIAIAWRVEGDVLRRATFEVTDGTALGVVPQVDAPTVYWVEAPDGARSDRYRISPIDPLLVSELVVEVRYPEYLGRAVERFDVEVPPLEVPQGTELAIRGRATRPLESAELAATDGRRVRLNVQDDGFSGRWTPTTSGTYEWRMTDHQTVNLSTAPTPIDIAIVDDAPPEVVITFPGVDTVLDAAMMQPITADARDDNGVSGAWLVSWRVGANGERDAPVEQPIRAAALEHALLRTALDASERSLSGGDTLKYFIRVADNSPGRQTAVSTTYSLWLPGRVEMRRRAVEQATAAIERAEELAESAQRLAETTRGVQRSTAASSSGGGRSSRSGGGGSPGSDGQSRSLDFETTEQVRGALDQQQKMLGDLEAQRQQLESMERAMESAGLRDPQLQERLQELRDLYDQILTPEMREQLEELRQALNEKDPEEIQKAVEDLAKEQEALQEQLDRSLDVLRKAAAEQEMNALAQEARELSTQQEALAESMKEAPPSEEQAEMQRQLEERADSLRRNIEKLQQKLSEQGETSASEQAGEASEQVGEASKSMGEASKSMGEAAKNGSEQQGEQASKSGQEAAEQMNEAADNLEAARESMAASGKKEAGDSVEQATNDALSLAQRQQDLLERMQQAMSMQQSSQQQDGEQQSGQQQSGQQQGGQQQGGQQQGGQQQGGQQQGGQQQGGQQQGGQQQGGQQQGGQQQGGQKQGGQQQGGQQQGGQQQGGQQQGGQQQGGQQQGGQQQGGQQGGQPQGGQQQGGQQQNGDGAGQGGSDELRSIQAEQAALQQSLEQLGRNLSETGERSPLLNRDVGSALGRANLSMQKTLESLKRAGEQGTMPTEEAAQTVDALNQLALSLLNNAQQIQQSEDGTGLQDSLEELTELAKDQADLSGQSRSLLPMNVAPQAMARQMGRMARDQRQIADRLGGMNSMRGAREDALGQLDELVREANRITRELEGSRLTPDLVARQERLFHRLLDAGRTYEREETTEERVAERPGAVEASQADALDPLLFEDGTRYRAPSPDELKNLPPAYRRLILEYFERLNRGRQEPTEVGEGAGTR